MLHTTLISPNKRFSSEVAEALRESGIEPVAVQHDKTEIFALQYAPAIPTTALGRLLRALRPLEPEPVRDASLPAGAVRLCLGDDAALKGVPITVAGESRKLREELRLAFAEAGFRRLRLVADLQARDVIEHGGISDQVLQRLLWTLARKGIRPQVKQVSDDGKPRVQICVTDPERRDLRPAERFTVVVNCDCPDSGLVLRRQLRRRGFADIEIEVLHKLPKAPGGAVIGVDPGPLGKLDATLEIAQLLAAAGDGARAAGIDTKRHPIRLIRGDAETPTLHLPFRACHEGRLAPYAGPYPERFPVLINSDDRADGARLRQSFRAAGFAEVSGSVQNLSHF